MSQNSSEPRPRLRFPNPPPPGEALDRAAAPSRGFSFNRVATDLHLADLSDLHDLVVVADVKTLYQHSGEVADSYWEGTRFLCSSVRADLDLVVTAATIRNALFSDGDTFLIPTLTIYVHWLFDANSVISLLDTLNPSYSYEVATPAQEQEMRLLRLLEIRTKLLDSVAELNGALRHPSRSKQLQRLSAELEECEFQIFETFGLERHQLELLCQLPETRDARTSQSLLLLRAALETVRAVTS